MNSHIIIPYLLTTYLVSLNYWLSQVPGRSLVNKSACNIEDEYHFLIGCPLYGSHHAVVTSMFYLHITSVHIIWKYIVSTVSHIP